jgi:hypothetical protein
MEGALSQDYFDELHKKVISTRLAVQMQNFLSYGNFMPTKNLASH